MMKNFGKTIIISVVWLVGVLTYSHLRNVSYDHAALIIYFIMIFGDILYNMGSYIVKAIKDRKDENAD